MPKTAARTNTVQKQADFTHTEPHAFPEDATPVAPRPSGRGPDGRFIAGNRGGPGNPHARHCARMLDLFRTCISDEDMVHLYRVLYDKAMKGDVSAAKLVLAYKIGKPSPCPDPDAIDRDEWDHYQQDAIEPKEVRQVLGSLPSRVGNDIARAALPIMTEARTRELATQLHTNRPVSPEHHAPATDASGMGEKRGPLPIGNSDREFASEQAPNQSPWAAAQEDGRASDTPGAGTLSPRAVGNAAPISQQASMPAPLRNGKSRGSTGTNRRKAKPNTPPKDLAR
jgi:hypothetical protein